jgi:hypothetical protein
MIAIPPATAAGADQSSVTIAAPKSVKPGARFSVSSRITVAGPDPAFLTGGVMDFDGTRLAPSKRRCGATPAGTFAADTPQSEPLQPGPAETGLVARNNVRRTGTLRYCLWVINARTYETEAAGSAYIKALAKSVKRQKRMAKPRAFTGHTAHPRLPVSLEIAGRQIRAFAITAAFRCSDSQRVSWGTRLPTFSFARSGRFRATPPPLGTINDAVKVSGRVQGRRVAGALSETYTSMLGNTCKSGTVKFTATAPKR